MNGLPAASIGVALPERAERPTREKAPRPAGRRRPSLSFRLLLLTLAIVALVEILIFLPGLSRERKAWMTTRLGRSHIAALSSAPYASDSLEPSERDELLRLSGALAVTVDEPGGQIFELRGEIVPAASTTLHLQNETSLEGLQRALSVLLGPGNHVMRVIGESPMRRGTVVDLLVPETSLRASLLEYARAFLIMALPIAILTGAFVYLMVLMVLVRPIRRLTDSIVAFRADPERTPPFDTRWLTSLAGGEIADAGEELAGMQRELRTALWRNARLAALGAAIAKVSHDLRNSLSPASMTAERLERHADPAVRRAGAMLLRSVDDAIELVGRMLDFAREVPPQLAIATVNLAELVEEAAMRLAEGGIRAVSNRIDPECEAQVDRALLLRVVSNLIRNAAEAGASEIEARVAMPPTEGMIVMELADNGPGLPADVQKRVFKPFVTSGKEGGTGLGLAIAADLMRAQGGSIALASTGPAGTVFELTMPTRSANGRALPQATAALPANTQEVP